MLHIFYPDYFTEFATIAFLHFIAVILPGPDFIITVRQSVLYGRLVGIYTAVGIGCGMIVNVSFYIFGVSHLIHSSVEISFIFRAFAIVYLLSIGMMMLVSTPQPFTKINRKSEDEEVDRPSLIKAWLIGFVTNISNPKAFLFLLAIFTTVVQEATPYNIKIFYGVWMSGVNIAWFVSMSLLFSLSVIREQFLQYGNIVERSIGTILIFFSIIHMYGLINNIPF